jgi:hypothetical protein
MEIPDQDQSEYRGSDFFWGIYDVRNQRILRFSLTSFITAASYFSFATSTAPGAF